MKKKPAQKTHKKVARGATKKTKSLFSDNRDWLLFTASVAVISVCVFYIFNLFQF